jgi:starch-binding outer membrane protein, SusD/RagB family
MTDQHTKPSQLATIESHTEEDIMNPGRLRRSQPCRRGLRSRAAILLAALPLLASTACEGLLDVDLPGEFPAEALNDPAIAPLLVDGAQTDLECAVSRYIYTMALWTGEFQLGGGQRASVTWATRLSQAYTETQGTCVGNLQFSPYLPMHIARAQSNTALEVLNNFSEQQIPNKTFLVAKAHAIGGYASQFLGEAFCSMAFDVGPEMTREATFKKAEERFTAAIEAASKVNTSGAREILNLARVGRARARLQLGNKAGVVEDAGQVDRGFVFLSTYDNQTVRRRNMLVENVNISLISSIGPMYRDRRFVLDGRPLPQGDPRLPIQNTGRVMQVGGTIWWTQQKYPSRTNANVPIATWREAQLMIAEVVLGQTAVNIINELRSTHGLPSFVPANLSDSTILAAVQEERIRELFLQGTRMGDKLRWREPWMTGFDYAGRPFGEDTCVPLPTQEVAGNPNL